MAVEVGTDKMSRNVGDKSTLRNITEDRKSYLQRNGSLKSCTALLTCCRLLSDLISSGVRRWENRKETGLLRLGKN